VSNFFAILSLFSRMCFIVAEVRRLCTLIDHRLTMSMRDLTCLGAGFNVSLARPSAAYTQTNRRAENEGLTA